MYIMASVAGSEWYKRIIINRRGGSSDPSVENDDLSYGWFPIDNGLIYFNLIKNGFMLSLSLKT